MWVQAIALRRQRLERSVKGLISLRLLGVPYRGGCPVWGGANSDLLYALHVLCRGDGLMAWPEEGRPVFVVESDPERFADWSITRASAFLGRKDRDKALSDALWSTLFTVRGRRRAEEPPGGIGPEPATVVVSGEVFPGREAVYLERAGAGEWVLVFESPWKADRGGREQRVMRALPEGVGPGQVWIWIPRELKPCEREEVTCYLAAAKALRKALSAEHIDEGRGRLVRELRQSYLGTCKPALEAIIDCYREGTIETDRGTWWAGERGASLVEAIADLVTWAGGGMDRERAFDKRCHRGYNGDGGGW